MRRNTGFKAQTHWSLLWDKPFEKHDCSDSYYRQPLLCGATLFKWNMVYKKTSGLLEHVQLPVSDTNLLCMLGMCVWLLAQPSLETASPRVWAVAKKSWMSLVDNYTLCSTLDSIVFVFIFVLVTAVVLLSLVSKWASGFTHQAVKIIKQHMQGRVSW